MNSTLTQQTENFVISIFNTGMLRDANRCSCDVPRIHKKYCAGATDLMITFYSVPVCPACGLVDTTSACREVREYFVADIPDLADMIEMPERQENSKPRRRRTRALPS
jgi:hypothetical protein